MTGPISPKEAADKKAKNIPDRVFDVFNELITKKLNGRISTVLQSEAVEAIMVRMDVVRDEVFDSHWLDIEDAYRKKGWTVQYDKPGYNDNYNAHWIFTAPREATS